jgi:hypothetical protein
MYKTYKTGDIHPIFNLLAFVEYDTDGVEVWTTIARDPKAPFRLALASKQSRQDCMSDAIRTHRNLPECQSQQ